jgi:hypothetical protein
MNRLSYSDLEAICKRQNCHPNELFLVGNDVFVMTDPVEMRSLPSNYRPLDVGEQGASRELLEILRGLDAVEFESMAELERALAYNATYTAEFDRLTDQLYDLLTAAHPQREAPDGGLYYLELEGSSGEDVLLVCDCAASLHDRLVDSMSGVLRNGHYSLDWRVRVSFEDDSTRIRLIGKDGLNHTS